MASSASAHHAGGETTGKNDDGNKTTISRHSFGDSDEQSFSLSIIESMKEDYGLFVWPSSVILAEYVWQQRSRFSGVTVVELGAGTCLPGLVAAKVGSLVTLTDDANRLEVLDNIRRQCDVNKLDCRVLGLTWGVWDESIFSLHPKIILGADVLYDNRAFDDLFATVTFLLQSSPSSVFITTYHNRSGHHLIEFLMVKWGLKCMKLIDGFSFLPSQKAARLTGNIQLAEIVLVPPGTNVLVAHFSAVKFCSAGLLSSSVWIYLGRDLLIRINGLRVIAAEVGAEQLPTIVVTSPVVASADAVSNHQHGNAAPDDATSSVYHNGVISTSPASIVLPVPPVPAPSSSRSTSAAAQPRLE